MLAIVFEIVETREELMGDMLDQRLETADLCFGEEGVESSSTHAVDVVLDGGKGGIRNAKLIAEPGPLVTLVGGAGVDNVVEVGVGNVDFLGVDADDGAIVVMELSDLEGVLAGEEDIMVEFVPKGELCEQGPGYVGNGAEIEAVDGEPGEIEQARDGRPEDEDCLRHCATCQMEGIMIEGNDLTGLVQAHKLPTMSDGFIPAMCSLVTRVCG